MSWTPRAKTAWYLAAALVTYEDGETMAQERQRLAQLAAAQAAASTPRVTGAPRARRLR